MSGPVGVTSLFARYHLLPIIVALTLALPPVEMTLAMAEPSSDQALSPSDLSRLYFPPTGHTLTGAFLRVWWEQGQLAVFGFPLTEEMIEEGRTVQYFERARFESFPEHRGTQYEVQFGLLGRLVTAGREREAAFRPRPPQAETPNRDYFEATGHTIADGFKDFWERHTGLSTFGYPISEAFLEQGQRVQYFERARFELHPSNPAESRILLGLLGSQVARRQELVITPVAPPADATTWTPSLADEIAAERRRRQYQTWLTAKPVAIEPFQAVVSAATANLRQAPTTAAPVVSQTYARHIVHIIGLAHGEPINGDDHWYQLMGGAGLISASLIRQFTPPQPPRTWTGRWIDVNLSTFYATAYEGDRPLYSALVTAGREGRTPLGVFLINRRVRRATMDSATVGIPPGHPEYYYLENVEYTQYFTDQGHALHGNYWVHPSRFGRFSSNGCIGLRNEDAAWFWEFARTGTPVSIHF